MVSSGESMRVRMGRSSFALQLAVPSKYRQQIVHKLHHGATGGDKTHSRLKEHFIGQATGMMWAHNVMRPEPPGRH